MAIQTAETGDGTAAASLPSWNNLNGGNSETKHLIGGLEFQRLSPLLS